MKLSSTSTYKGSDC